MKKASFFEWFCPWFAIIAVLPVLFVVQAALEWIQAGEYTFFSWILEMLCCLIPIVGLPGIAIYGVCYATDMMTEHMGDSSYKTDKGYYEAKLDGDTIKIDRAYDYHTTKAGWLRWLMRITYLFWSIPGYILYTKKYKHWRED